MRLHNRQVKAEFWTDADLLRQPRDVRMFYQGLWHCSEDSACLEDSAFALKLLLFPSPVDADITVEVIDDWIEVLVRLGKIIRYGVKTKRYLYLTRFHKHQTLRNPGASEVPLPPWLEWQIPREEKDSNGRTIRVSGRYVLTAEPPEPPEPSDYAIDTSFIPVLCRCDTEAVPTRYDPGSASKVREGKVSEKNKRACASDDARDSFDDVEASDPISKQTPSVEAQKVTAKAANADDRFRRFWTEYPKKRSKGQAQKAWLKLKPDRELFQQIMSGLAQARTSHDWTKDGGQFIPYPATWLNARGWEDEYDGPSTPLSTPPSDSLSEEELAYMEELRKTLGPIGQMPDKEAPTR